MVPFVRTLAEARRVTELLAEHGLRRGSGAVNGNGGLRLIMMCEVPSNAMLADQFLDYFDGFSIGSNDLTQLTLGLDRDSGAGGRGLRRARSGRQGAADSRRLRPAAARGKYIGICGQGPSDHVDFAEWLVEQGIESISLNPGHRGRNLAAARARGLMRTRHGAPFIGRGHDALEMSCGSRS